MKMSIVALALAVAVSGCAGVGAKVAGVVAKPVLTFAVADAQTTLAWVEREVGAGRLNATEASFAKSCPDAVLALDALRQRLAGAEEDAVKGKKGLIYFGTVAKYTKSVKKQAVGYLQSLMGACAPLIPAEKLLRLF